MNGRLRWWPRSLWLNGALLGCLLMLVLPFVGLRGVYLNDEGAALAQATQLRDNGTWFFRSNFPEADPRGLSYPFDRATHTEHGFAPLLKHPLYPLLLVGAGFAGGRVGIAVLGIIGTVIAAIAAGLIAREIRPGLELWCLWTVGVASPLFFDAFIVLAHSLGAAGIGVAGLGVVRYLRRGGGANVALCIAGLVWTISLRTEGLLLGLAMSAVLVAISFTKGERSHRVWTRTRLIGAVTIATTLLAGLVERVVIGVLAPTVLPTTTSPLPEFGFLAGRLNVFVVTWLFPGYGYGGYRLLGPIILLIFGVLLVVQIRRKRADRAFWIVTLLGLWAGAIFWIGAARRVMVPGLLPAFPLLVVALVAWKKPHPADQVVTVLAGTVTLFAGLVLATEYAVGGTIEWGSRYLAIGIPLVAPLIVRSIARLGRSVPADRRSLAALALIPLAVTPAVVSATSQRAIRQEIGHRVEQTVERADKVDPGDGGKPVVVTEVLSMPRIAWDHVDDYRWLAVEPDQLDRMTTRLDGLGVRQFLLVTGVQRVHVGPKFTVQGCARLGSPVSDWLTCRITATTPP